MPQQSICTLRYCSRLRNFITHCGPAASSVVNRIKRKNKTIAESRETDGQKDETLLQKC